MERKDQPVMPGEPKGYHREETQMDGNPVQRFTPPTKGKGLQTREAAPARSSDSGIERAMGALANKMHRR